MGWLRPPNIIILASPPENGLRLIYNDVVYFSNIENLKTVYVMDFHLCISMKSTIHNLYLGF